MTTTLIDAGVYDAHEVSRLLAVHVERVIRWAAPDGKGRPPLVRPTFERAFSFLDLVSFAVADKLWDRGVTEVDLRNGVVYLERETGYEKPLAHKQVVDALATSGANWLVTLHPGWYDIGKGGQGAFEEVIRLTLRAVSFDDLGVAELWRPAPLVVLDPRVQAGSPCVEGTRVPTEVIASMVEASDAPSQVADDLDLTDEQVQAALRFESHLAEGRGIAA